MPNVVETDDIHHSEAPHDAMISHAERAAKIKLHKVEYGGLMHILMVTAASSPSSLGITCVEFTVPVSIRTGLERLVHGSGKLEPEPAREESYTVLVPTRQNRLFFKKNELLII